MKSMAVIFYGYYIHSQLDLNNPNLGTISLYNFLQLYFSIS